MKNICVYCGSSPGAGNDYVAAARNLGYTFAANSIRLIYGGSDVGLMSVIAHAVLEKGGEVTGVIPESLVKKEVAFTGLKDLRVVKTMHERKFLMSELADGFIAMPGGLGTIEEFLEVLTWGQLGIHQKPCGLLNVSRFYNIFLDFLNHAIEKNFMRKEDLEFLLVDSDPLTLIQKLKKFSPPELDKAAWILEMKTKRNCT